MQSKAKAKALLARMSSILDDLSPDETIGFSNGVQWIEVATVEEIRSAALSEKQAAEVKSLDERMKSAGMYTIAEMMGVTPLTRWRANPAINTLDAFSEWLDRKVAEYLTMKAGYDLGDETEDDELYEWVLAHSGVFSTVRDQFQVVRSALVDVPVEPVAWRSDSGAYFHGAKRPYVGPSISLEPLYTSPPLSHRGEDSAEVYRQALERIAKASARGWNVETATEALNTARAIAETALAATRSGSATTAGSAKTWGEWERGQQSEEDQ